MHHVNRTKEKKCHMTCLQMDESLTKSNTLHLLNILSEIGIISLCQYLHFIIQIIANDNLKGR